MGRKQTKDQIETGLSKNKSKKLLIKLRLNATTTVTLSNKDKMAYWLNLYPNAKLV